MANGKIYDRINEQSPWQDITEGNKIFEAATSKDFCTGEWRTATPVWSQEKCKQCLLCTPVCRICARVCPFGAISMREGK